MLLLVRLPVPSFHCAATHHFKTTFHEEGEETSKPRHLSEGERLDFRQAIKQKLVEAASEKIAAGDVTCIEISTFGHIAATAKVSTVVSSTVVAQLVAELRRPDSFTVSVGQRKFTAQATELSHGNAAFPYLSTLNTSIVCFNPHECSHAPAAGLYQLSEETLGLCDAQGKSLRVHMPLHITAELPVTCQIHVFWYCLVQFDRLHINPM